MSRRVKIKPVYPSNLFYEKVLTDWKANSTNKKGSFTIKKALDNLKVYPLVLNGYTDLRRIKGMYLAQFYRFIDQFTFNKSNDFN
jgi:hypothetical protein